MPTADDATYFLPSRAGLSPLGHAAPFCCAAHSATYCALEFLFLDRRRMLYTKPPRDGNTPIGVTSMRLLSPQGSLFFAPVIAWSITSICLLREALLIEPRLLAA